MTTDVLTYDEAAAFLKCSRRTLERWVKRKRIPSFRGPGGRQFSRSSLEEWVREQIAAQQRRSRKLEVVA